MAIKTRQDYLDSLRKLKLNLWMFGEKVASPVDHQIIIPSMNAVSLTYELALKPEYEDLMTATSHLTGKRVNRFNHIFQSTEDVVKESPPRSACWDKKQSAAFSSGRREATLLLCVLPIQSGLPD